MRRWRRAIFDGGQSRLLPGRSDSELQQHFAIDVVALDTEIRVGLNLGDVIIDEDDVYGNALNIAARLEALADPGGRGDLNRGIRTGGDRVPDSFEDLGDQQVKNIARSPIARRQKGRRYRYYISEP